MLVRIKYCTLLFILFAQCFCSACNSRDFIVEDIEISNIDNSKNSINIIVAESGDVGKQFENLLGQGSCRIEIVCESGWSNELLLFVRNEDNFIVAESSQSISEENESYYVVDIDRDGIYELICNCQYATGPARVLIYRNNEGTIECGYIQEEYICQRLGLDHLDAPYTFKESFVFDRNVVRVILLSKYYDEFTEDKVLEISLNEYDAIEYLKYEPSEYDIGI